MAKRPPARSTYAKTVGEISIWWNHLEGELNNLSFHYMREDSTIAGFILGNMGNQTKADFATLLVNRFEKNKTVKEHALHSIALFNRIRENRNILEHAIPHVNFDERYLGKVSKLDRNADFKAFEAPIELLTELLKSMKSAHRYSRRIRSTGYVNREAAKKRVKGDRPVARMLTEILASLGKPPLPRKISQLELEEAPTADTRPPRSSPA